MYVEHYATKTQQKSKAVITDNVIFSLLLQHPEPVPCRLFEMWWHTRKRLKVKGREAGVYSAQQLKEAHCTLTPWRSSLIHLQRRHHTKRREIPLLAKKGTFIEGILLAIRNLLQLLGSFTWRKVGTWDRLFNFPSEGRHAEDFVHRKNPTASAGFEPANAGTRGQHANHRSRLHTRKKPDFVFRRNGRVHLNRPGGVSSVGYWQPRCAHQR
jgi:hypothetical protein